MRVLALALLLAPAAASAGMPLAALDDLCARIAGRLASVSPADCTDTGLTVAERASVEGLPILYGDYPALRQPAAGRRPPRVLLVGGIHGDELTSVSVSFRWLAQVAADPRRAVHWRIVPCLNPDGLLRRPATRTNARGVDLNRNFPVLPDQPAPLAYWARRTGRDPRRWPGPEPLSEPEARWLAAQIEDFAPDVLVQVHAPYGVLDYDGPPEPPRRIGYLRLKPLGAYPGSLGNWMGIVRGIPTVTLELPHAGIMPGARQQARMFSDLQRWVARHVQAPAEPAPWLRAAGAWRHAAEPGSATGAAGR